MADKQLNYPIGLLPSWANDQLIVDPPEAWDGTDTKVEPGAGKRNTGYLPEENPTAQHLNHQLNELGRWVQYLSSIQILNWQSTEPRDAGAAQINSCECVCYDEGFVLWVVAGRSDEVSGTSDPSHGNEAWFELGPTTDPKTWTWAQSKRPDQLPTHVGLMTVLSHSLPSATCNVAELTSGGGWLIYSVPGVGTTGIRQHEYDEFNQRWVFVGVTNAAVTPQPAIWTQTAPIGGALTPRAAAAVNSTLCQAVAVSSAGLAVVLGDGAPFDVWTSPDAVTFTRATPTGIVGGESARAIMWDEARQRFIMTTTKSVYTSTNGTAWTLLVTYATGNFAYRCLANDGGGMYVAANDFSDPLAVRYSVDGGSTWRIKPVPNELQSTKNPTQIAYSRNNGQFAMTHDDNPNQGRLVFSLAVGEALWDPDVVLQLPTVT